MKHLKVLGLLAVALAALPLSAQAEMAYAAKEVHLRAGPAVDYPIVITLPAGVVLDVQGCLSDYRWCDVVSGPDRGWVYAANIVYPYRGQNVPVLSYGAMLGIGIIAFSLGAYWDSYYVDRPWYPQRPLWIRRPPPRFVPDVRRLPPPPPPGYRPPGGQYPAQPGARPPGQPRPPQPGARPPGDQHPQQPAARPPADQRPTPPVTQPPQRPQRPPLADRPQSKPQPVKSGPGTDNGHRPQHEQGSGVR